MHDWNSMKTNMNKKYGAIEEYKLLVEKAGFALHNDMFLRNLLKKVSFSLFSKWPADPARLIWLARCGGVLSQLTSVKSLC